MAGEKVRIKLTPRQMSKLQPLFKEAGDAADMDEQGIVLFQPLSNGDLTGLFFPMKFAERLIDVAKDYKTYLRMEEDHQKGGRRRRG